MSIRGCVPSVEGIGGGAGGIGWADEVAKGNGIAQRRLQPQGHRSKEGVGGIVEGKLGSRA